MHRDDQFVALPAWLALWSRHFQATQQCAGEDVVLVFERAVKAGQGRVDGEP